MAIAKVSQICCIAIYVKTLNSTLHFFFTKSLKVPGIVHRPALARFIKTVNAQRLSQMTWELSVINRYSSH